MLATLGFAAGGTVAALAQPRRTRTGRERPLASQPRGASKPRWHDLFGQPSRRCACNAWKRHEPANGCGSRETRPQFIPRPQTGPAYYALPVARHAGHTRLRVQYFFRRNLHGRPPQAPHSYGRARPPKSCAATCPPPTPRAPQAVERRLGRNKPMKGSATCGTRARGRCPSRLPPRPHKHAPRPNGRRRCGAAARGRR